MECLEAHRTLIATSGVVEPPAFRQPAGRSPGEGRWGRSLYGEPHAIRQQGNTLAAPVRKAPTAAAETWTRWDGTATIPATSVSIPSTCGTRTRPTTSSASSLSTTAARILSAASAQTPGACTTCTGTFGSGAATIMVITPPVRRRIQPAHSRARRESCAAGRGTSDQPSAAPPFATSTRPTPGTFSSDFGCAWTLDPLPFPHSQRRLTALRSRNGLGRTPCAGSPTLMGSLTTATRDFDLDWSEPKALFDRVCERCRELQVQWPNS
jgi:hypothetical protein